MSKELNNKGHDSPEMVALANIRNIINEKLIKLRKKNEEAIKDY